MPALYYLPLDSQGGAGAVSDPREANLWSLWVSPCVTLSLHMLLPWSIAASLAPFPIHEAIPIALRAYLLLNRERKPSRDPSGHSAGTVDLSSRVPAPTLMNPDHFLPRIFTASL